MRFSLFIVLLVSQFYCSGILREFPIFVCSLLCKFFNPCIKSSGPVPVTEQSVATHSDYGFISGQVTWMVVSCECFVLSGTCL
jgi:hypothetical protein